MAPCSPWTTPEEVRGCCAGLDDNVDLSPHIQFASAILWRLSGRQFAGECPRLVWPPCACGRAGDDPMWATLQASAWDAGLGGGMPSVPLRDGAGWANDWRSSCAGPCRQSAIRLPNYIQRVNEVVIDGAVLPASAYVIKANRKLVRMDGHAWPCMNDYSEVTPYEDAIYALEIDSTGGTADLTVTGPGTTTSTIQVGETTTAADLASAVGDALGPDAIVEVTDAYPMLIRVHTRPLGFVPVLTLDAGTLVGTVDFEVVQPGAVSTVGWYIDYVGGTPVPPDGRTAAAIFACELAKGACGDDDCVLPARLKSLSREGVDMAFADPMDFLEEGKVGIYQVDLWIRSVNPSGRRRRATVTRADARPGSSTFRR